MKEKELIANTVNKIVNQLSDDVPVKRILLNLQILIHYLDDVEFASWLQLEVDGYPDVNSVPDYRKVDAVIFASGARPYGRFSNVKVSVSNIGDDEITNMLENAILIHPIIEIEKLATKENESGVLHIHLNAWSYSYLSKQLHPMLTVDQAYQKISVASLEHVVQTFKSKVLEAMLNLRTRLNIKVTTPSVNSEPTSSSTFVANNSSITISGENIAIGNENTIHTEGVKLTELKVILDNLSEELNKNDLSNELIEYVEEAQEGIKESRSSRFFRMAFAGMMNVAKAAGATSTIIQLIQKAQELL